MAIYAGDSIGGAANAYNQVQAEQQRLAQEGNSRAMGLVMSLLNLKNQQDQQRSALNQAAISRTDMLNQQTQERDRQNQLDRLGAMQIAGQQAHMAAGDQLNQQYYDLQSKQFEQGGTPLELKKNLEMSRRAENEAAQGTFNGVNYKGLIPDDELGYYGRLNQHAVDTMRQQRGFEKTIADQLNRQNEVDTAISATSPRISALNKPPELPTLLGDYNQYQALLQERQKISSFLKPYEKRLDAFVTTGPDGRYTPMTSLPVEQAAPPQLNPWGRRPAQLTGPTMVRTGLAGAMPATTATGTNAISLGRSQDEALRSFGRGNADNPVMPKSKGDLVPGQVYLTPRGNARWDGRIFIPVP